MEKVIDIKLMKDFLSDSLKSLDMLPSSASHDYIAGYQMAVLQMIGILSYIENEQV